MKNLWIGPNPPDQLQKGDVVYFRAYFWTILEHVEGRKYIAVRDGYKLREEVEFPELEKES